MSETTGYDTGYDPTPLTAKQQKAAVLLAEGETGVAVAKQVKVTPQTIVQWRKKHLFQAAFNLHRQNIIDASREAVRAGIHKASVTLLELLDDSDPKVKLQAAKLFLDKTDSPEMVGWGIGETSVEKIIEKEYRKAHPLTGLLSLGGEPDDGILEQITEIVRNADTRWVVSMKDSEDDDSEE